MKAQMKRIVGYIILGTLFAVFVVGLCFVIKNNAFSLTISMKNVSVNKGDQTIVVYYCNSNEATINLEIEDESIAVLVKEDGKYYVKGLEAGETKIKLTARYNKYKNYITKRVTVIEEETQEPTMTYAIDIVSGCSPSGEKGFQMEAGTAALIKIRALLDDITSTNIICSNTNVSVQKKSGEPNTYRIESDVAGTYTLLIRVNGIGRSVEENYTLTVS